MRANKKTFLLSMAILLLLSACGSNPKGNRKEISEKPLVFANAAENINYELEDARTVEQPMDTMTVSEQISMLIMEQVQVTLVEDKGSSAMVSVTYPDAGARLVELLSKYGDDAADLAMEALRDELKNKKITLQTLQTEVAYADMDAKTILWTEALVDAMSGGMYSLANGQ